MLPCDEPTGSFHSSRNDESFEEIVIDGDEEEEEEEEEIRVVYEEDEALERSTHDVFVLVVEPDKKQKPVMLDVPDESEDFMLNSDNFEEIEIDVCPEIQNEVEVHAENSKQLNNIDENVSVENEKQICDSDMETEKLQIPTLRNGPVTPEKSNKNRESVELIDSPILGRKYRTSKRRSAGKKSLSNEIVILTIYPPPPAKGGISINSEDYKCLAVDEFLNDVIIDFYLKYLLNEVLSPDDKRRTHIFSSHFFTRLANPYATNSTTNDEGNGCFRYGIYDDDEDNAETKAAARLRHAGVERWTKNVDIFEKDFIIVPINEAAHWYLAIICFPYLVGIVGQRNSNCVSFSDEQRKPCILILDSLSSGSKAKVAGILREYLYFEYIAKTQDEKEFSFGAMKTVYVKVPKQTNATDCGLYLLQYVESFFQNPIQDFTVPFKDLTSWFRWSDIKTKRLHIARIIFNLSIGSGNGEEVKSIPLKTSCTPSSKSSPPSPSVSTSPAPPLPPRSYRAQRKIVSSDEEQEEERGDSSPSSLITLNYKLRNMANTVRPEQQLPVSVQTRAGKILNATTKTYSKRKNSEKWVSKCRTSPRKTNQLQKSIFSSSPTELFSDYSNMSQFNAGASSDDKFYNLSFDALKKETGISPRMSYKNFKIKKLSTRVIGTDDF